MVQGSGPNSVAMEIAWDLESLAEDLGPSPG